MSSPEMFKRRARRSLSAGVSIAAMALTVSACGSGSNGNNDKNGSDDATSGVVTSLADRVPDAIKKAGTVKGVTDSNYPPFTFLEGQKNTGVEIDLVEAAMAKLGLTVNWTNQPFAGIIPSLQAGRYDFAATAMTMQPERAKVVKMVSEFNQPQQFLGPASLKNPPTTSKDLCGLRAAVISASTGERDFTAWSKDCTDNSKDPINILKYPSGSEVNLALTTGRADVTQNGHFIIKELVKNSNGKLKAMGEPFGEQLVSVAFDKDSEISAVFVDALQDLMDSPAYLKILEKFDVQVGALKKVETLG